MGEGEEKGRLEVRQQMWDEYLKLHEGSSISEILEHYGLRRAGSILRSARERADLVIQQGYLEVFELFINKMLAEYGASGDDKREMIIDSLGTLVRDEIPDIHKKTFNDPLAAFRYHTSELRKIFSSTDRNDQDDTLILLGYILSFKE